MTAQILITLILVFFTSITLSNIMLSEGVTGKWEILLEVLLGINAITAIGLATLGAYWIFIV